MEIFHQGDILILDLNPQSGHEQMGRRPVLVVSTDEFNVFTRAAIICPITNTRRDHPLHIPLDARTRTTGFIMCDQVKALDITSRNAVFAEVVPLDIIRRVSETIEPFFDPPEVL